MYWLVRMQNNNNKNNNNNNLNYSLIIRSVLIITFFSYNIVFMGVVFILINTKQVGD